MKTLSFAIILAITVQVHAQSEFTSDLQKSIKEFISPPQNSHLSDGLNARIFSNSPVSLQELVSHFSAESRKRTAYVFQTRSNQQVTSLEEPRTIVPLSGGRLFMAFIKDPKKKGGKFLEIEKKNFETGEWDFYLKNLENGEITKNPQSCRGCHKSGPIWDSFPVWPGVFGTFAEPDGRALSVFQNKDLAAFSAFIDSNRRDPIFGPMLKGLYLEDLKGTASTLTSQILATKIYQFYERIKSSANAKKLITEVIALAEGNDLFLVRELQQTHEYLKYKPEITQRASDYSEKRKERLEKIYLTPMPKDSISNYRLLEMASGNKTIERLTLLRTLLYLRTGQDMVAETSLTLEKSFNFFLGVDDPLAALSYLLQIESTAFGEFRAPQKCTDVFKDNSE